MISERSQAELSEPLPAEAEEQTRELTIEEAVQVATMLQQAGRLEESDIVYKRILDAAPDHPAALHYCGVLGHQLGQHDEAIARIERSLAVGPEQADWRNNYGIALQGAGRLEDAIAAYRRAIELDPAHANAFSNMGVLLRATGKPEEAEAAYRKALELNPKHIDAWTNLGILLNGLKRTEEAVNCYCKVILLRPSHKEARRMLALAHCTLGEVDEAIKIFEDWLKEEPGDEVATHMLAACTGQAIPARASDAFVSRTFDTFAASFESKLAQLHYRAPRLVFLMLEDMGIPAARVLDILDAGCGTGLCGPLLAPYARTMVGVDLSAGMLKQAAEKVAKGDDGQDRPIYDSLLNAELTSYLLDHPDSYDVIVSADTLCYFGQLEDVIAAGAASLRPGGMLILTLERAAGDSTVDGAPVPDYRLELHGRYSHGRAYVERLLAASGLGSEIIEADLRMESGVPVAGLVIRATKPNGAGINHG